jgi:hypothetical protein
MPTGYTAAIADNITFERYALNCARAFGALVHMRDDPSDAPIPDRIEPCDFYKKSLEGAHQTLDRISTWTSEQIEIEYLAHYEDLVRSHAKRHQGSADLRAKYTAMLLAVRAWTAPTPDHVKFKEFMEDQIIQSIAFDCDVSYDRVPEAQEPSQWHAEWIADLKANIARYEDEHQKEVRRAHERTQWIKALRESLA